MKVFLMLEEAGANINSVSEKGESVLTYAINGVVPTDIDPIIEYLLKKTSIGEKVVCFIQNTH